MRGAFFVEVSRATPSGTSVDSWKAPLADCPAFMVRHRFVTRFLNRLGKVCHEVELGGVEVA